MSHQQETGIREGGRYTVVVGDILRSTHFPDQKALFTMLQKQFDWVNSQVNAAQPLAFTVGDEFQAAYQDPISAHKAIILLRLRFNAQSIHRESNDEPSAPEQRIRIGLAEGVISVFNENEAPYGQSGEAWWNARKAIEQAEKPKSNRYVPYATQTRYSSRDLKSAAMTNSFWLALDQVLYRMDKVDMKITLELWQNRTQKQISEKLKLSQPVVSRRSKRNGVFTVLSILDEMESVSQ